MFLLALIISAIFVFLPNMIEGLVKPISDDLGESTTNSDVVSTVKTEQASTVTEHAQSIPWGKIGEFLGYAAIVIIAGVIIFFATKFIINYIKVRKSKSYLESLSAQNVIKIHELEEVIIQGKYESRKKRLNDIKERTYEYHEEILRDKFNILNAGKKNCVYINLHKTCTNIREELDTIKDEIWKLNNLKI